MMADGFGLSAALSFYTLFALAPMLVFSVLVASNFLGREGAREGAQKWLENFVSVEEADALVGLINVDYWANTSGWVATVVTAIMFMWAASLTFVRIRISVNRLLGNAAGSVGQAVKSSLLGRLHAILLTLAAGFVMVLGIWGVTVVSSVPVVEFLGSGWLAEIFLKAASSLLLALGALWVIRLLPMKAPTWRHTFIGLVFILIAFEIGRSLLNLYLEHSQIVSVYGAANTLVIFLLWIYYMAQTFLIGVTIIGALDEGEADE